MPKVFQGFLIFIVRRAGAMQPSFCNYREEQRKYVVFCGLSEPAEVASLRAQEYNIALLGVDDPEANTGKFLGSPIGKRTSELAEADVLILTALMNTT